jgi:hypothetical protein
MKGSGKTRTLSLISKLSKNGEILTSLTEAVLFRSKGTLCVDELEKTEGKEKLALRELLNSAYKKGIKVKRTKQTKNGGYEIEEFNVFRPIVMANIWGLENVLGDRCIRIILEKSSKREITKIIEDFDENDEILNITSHLKGICDISDVDIMVLENPKRHWNRYIKSKNSPSKDVTNVSKVYNVNNVNNVNNNNLFIKIDKTQLSGRDLELFYPLFIIANNCGKLDEILKISQKIMSERKDIDIEENRDVQLIEFISQYKNEDFVSVTKLTNEFREVLGIPEKQSGWLNNRWVGRALRRLVLVKDKHRTGKVREVRLNIEKAKEKIKMFKIPEEKQEKLSDEKIETQKIG